MLSTKNLMCVLRIGIFGMVVLMIGIFAILTAFYSDISLAWVRFGIAAVLVPGVGLLGFVRPRWKTIPLCLGLLILSLGWRWRIHPSNDRDWRRENAILTTYQSGADNQVEVRNLRNFQYRSKDDFEVRYENRTYDIRKANSVDFAISYWGDDGEESIAHTFLSFGFEGDEWLSVSIEIRAERGEKFHPVPGLFRQYELMYVVGDERDILGSRIEQRGERVYLYPSRATPQQSRELLIEMLDRANQLAEKPEFYSSLGANCTVSLLGHVTSVLKTEVPFSRQLILNGLSDRFAYDQGYLVNDLPFHVLKKVCYVKSDGISADQSYSKIIRERRDTALSAERKLLKSF